jgi:hypothetical protein
MRMKVAFLALVACLGVSILTGISQTVPQLINYQGRLYDSVGQPVNGPVAMQFRLLDGNTSGSTLLWSEVQNPVTVNQGVYNVLLGSVTPIPYSVFDRNAVFLEVIVAGQTLEPRQRISSVAYSMRAQSSQNADQLDSLDSTAFAPTSHGHNDIYYTKPEVDALVGGGGGGGYSKAEVDALIANLQGQINTLQAQVDTNTSNLAAHDILLTDHQARIVALETKLANVIVVGTDFILSGVNVYVQNGSGTTSGAVNGLGNLIVGYNELRGTGNDRTGSHNLVVGTKHNYSSFGGLAVGENNTLSSSYASVTGGSFNTASGTGASVSGGRQNIASGDYSTVAGGGGVNAAVGNEAYSHYSAILGGESNDTGNGANRALGQNSTVSGGKTNRASGTDASVSGGESNNATNASASVSGGTSNTASGQNASVSGGQLNTANTTSASVSGGYSNLASGQYSSVTGGETNSATARSASTSGGLTRSATGAYDWVAGALTQNQ